MENNPLFVKIDSPMELKKAIIDTAISSIMLLKDLERSKVVERQGAEVASMFISTIKNVEKQIDALSKLFPNIQGKTFSSAQSYAEPVTIDIGESSSNSSNIEIQLKDIEAKLRNLNV